MDLAKRIILQGAPIVFSEWMTWASVLDGYERRANHFFASAANRHGNHQRGNNKRNTWKPRAYVPREEKNTYMGEPMEIDRLDPQEEKRRRDNKLCFNCGKPGHFASEHKQGGLSNQQRNNREEQRPQKEPWKEMRIPRTLTRKTTTERPSLNCQTR